MRKHRFFIFRIIYVFKNRPTKTIRVSWRTNDIEYVRKLVKGLEPTAKIRFCYTEFNYD